MATAAESALENRCTRTRRFETLYPWDMGALPRSLLGAVELIDDRRQMDAAADEPSVPLRKSWRSIHAARAAAIFSGWSSGAW